MTPEQRDRVERWCHQNAPFNWKGFELNEAELFRVVESSLKLIDLYQQLPPKMRETIAFIVPMLNDLTVHPDLAELEEQQS